MSGYVVIFGKPRPGLVRENHVLTEQFVESRHIARQHRVTQAIFSLFDRYLVVHRITYSAVLATAYIA